MIFFIVFIIYHKGKEDFGIETVVFYLPFLRLSFVLKSIIMHNERKLSINWYPNHSSLIGNMKVLPILHLHDYIFVLDLNLF
jgi:hypothetical protein